MKRELSLEMVTLALMFFITFTEHLLIFAYPPMILEIMSEMKLTYAQAGFIFSACIMMLILLRIPWGLFCDWAGCGDALRLATILMGLFGFLRGAAPNYAGLLVFQLLCGLGIGGVMPSMPKLASTRFSRRRLGLVTSIYTSGFALGSIAGLGLTPYLLALTGEWRAVFYVYGVWALTVALAWWVISRKAAARDGKARQPRTTFHVDEFLSILRMKEVWILVAISSCALGSYDALSIWLPTMLELRGFPPTTAGQVASTISLGFLAAGACVGAVSDRLGRRRPLISLLSLLGGFVILTLNGGSGLVLWFSAFLTGFFTMGVVTLVWTVLAGLPSGGEMAGSMAGIVCSLGNLGSFILPALMGYVRDVTGSFSVAVASVAALAWMPTVLAWMLKETGVRGNLKRGFGGG